MNLLKPITLLLCLSWTLTTLVSAQKVDHDPRPLEKPEVESIPVYEPVQAFLSAERSSLLREVATPVGTASINNLPAVVRMIRQGEIGAQKSAPSLHIQPLKVRRAQNGTVRWMNGDLGRVEASKHGLDPISAALYVLDEHASLLQLREPSKELRGTGYAVDELGFAHVRFEQVYDGIPVWGRDLYVHFNTSGEVYAINGAYEPTPHEINREFNLDAADAHGIVVSDLQSRDRWAPVPDEAASMLGLDAVESELIYFPLADGSMRPAYEVSLHPNLIEWYTYIIDAKDGSILNRIQRHCTLHYDPTASPAEIRFDESAIFDTSPTLSGTFHDAQATDLNGVVQRFRAYRHSNNVYYKIWDLPNYSAAGSTMPNEPAGGAVTISANNKDLEQSVELLHVTSSDNTWSDRVAVSAHTNMRVAYDYFRDTHGRKAIDDNDQSLISIIHITENGQQVDNAFWNGRVMIYGNGREVFKPLAGSLDTGGHEMSHGVIQHTANLIYQFQPGALNESFADVFGVLIDPDNMLLGETIMLPGKGIALRDLLNPNNPQVFSPQPAHMRDFRELSLDQDNGGVHVNSGIPNRAAALIMQAIGHGKTGDIYYRALSRYLTRNSEFVDARNAVEQATKDLYGEGAELNAVRSAFDAVGINSGTGDGGSGPTVPVLVGGQSIITFMMTDGRIGTADVTSPDNISSALFQHAQAVARASEQIQDRSQLTTGRSGERIWFVNAQRRLAYIDVASGDVSVFENLHLYEPGDLWNASVSPGEDYVALVSAYLGDPTIYIFDGERVGAIPLEPETSQDGIKATTVEYPDVISWSPDPEDHRLIFDAFNAGGSGLGGLLEFWSIYELDLPSNKVFNLLPAQPTTMSVGNVAYSRTNPHKVVFNSVDNATGVHDVVLGNFNTGEIRFLNMPSLTLNGRPVYDAQRPTFSPDDNVLAMAAPQLGVLLFADIEANTFSYLSYDTPLYNPHWFVLGGQAATDTETLPAAASALHSVYPNPFTGTATIRFEVAQAGDAEIAVFDLIGRRVATVTAGRRPAGVHEVRFDAHDLPSGSYFVRLTLGRETYHRQIIAVR